MKIRSFFVSASVLAVILGIGVLWAMQMHFRSSIEGAMSPLMAAKLSLIKPDLADSPFGVKRVWFSKAKDGRRAYMSAWPIIGLVPLDPFGSGSTNLDLNMECNKSPQDCQLING